MMKLLYLAVGFVKALLSLMKILVFSSCILSNIPKDGKDLFPMFVTRLGDVILYPIKGLCKNIGIINSLPFDISYIVAFVILQIMGAFLPTITVQ